jgi:hypothetical protein
MSYWLAVGSVKNWDTAFNYGNIWGLKETQRNLWEGLQEKDKVLFHATHPVSGIIGYGIVRTKIRQNKPLWPEEVRKNTVIWPLRFEFDVKSCFARTEWKTRKLTSEAIWPRSGFQLLSKDVAEGLISAIGKDEYATKNFEPSLIAEKTAEFISAPKEQRAAPMSHDELQIKLTEIGRLQNYIAEMEYTCDIGKLDVVWRRVTNSVPTYVFEIQVGGDIYHALAKLKHAFDLWNSHIFIVAPEAARNKVDNLLSGTFHEINRRIEFIELGQVEELYKRKKSYLDFEKGLGIN